MEGIARIPPVDIKDMNRMEEDLGTKGQEITSAPVQTPDIDFVPIREGLFTKILKQYSPEKPSASLNAKTMVRPGLAIGGMLPMESQLETSSFMKI